MREAADWPLQVLRNVPQAILPAPAGGISEPCPEAYGGGEVARAAGRQQIDTDRE